MRLGDALRPLADPLEIQRTAMRVLGEHLQADRVLYAEIQADDRHFVIADNYVRGNVAKMIGRFPLSDYSNAQQSQRRGETFVLPDIRNAGESNEQAAFLAVWVQALIGVPLHKDGRWVASLTVHQGSPRAWSPEETAFVIDTAERTWAAVERAHAETALRESQERLRLALDASEMGTYRWYPQEDRGELDARMLRLFGLREGDSLTLAEALATIIHPDDRDFYAHAVARALDPNGDGKIDVDFRVVHPDESLHWLDIYGHTSFTDENPPRAALMHGMALDITARKRTEVNLAFLAEVSKDLVRLTNIGETMEALDAKIGGHFNASRCAFLEFNEAADTAVCEYDWHLPELPSFVGSYRPADFYNDEFLQILRSGQAFVLRDRDADTRADAKTLAAFDLAALIVIPISKAGLLRFVLCIYDSKPRDWTEDEIELMREITSRIWTRLERARAEAALRESEERFRALVGQTAAGIYRSDLGGRLTFANRTFLDMLGYIDEAEVIGQTIWDVTHDDAVAKNRQLFARLSETGEGFEIEKRLLRQDGEPLWAVVSVAAMRGADGKPHSAVAVVLDVSERKMSEERLHRNAETFASLVQGAPFGIYVVNADFRIAQVSAGALPMFGDVAPLLGRDLAEVLRLIWTEPFAGEAVSKFRQTLETGEPYIAVSTEQREDRAGVESYDWRIERVTLPDGSYGVVCYFHDVTVTQAATQRLEVINEAQRRFVSDAAHELRAPLTSIRGNLSLLRRYSNIADEERTEMLGDAEREATRLTRLIADLLMVARGEAREEIELERVALEQSLEAAWRTARSLSERRRFDLGTLKPMVVLGDSDALVQLFLILLENAVKYSPEDGAVRLETIECDGWAEVRVHNDGAGIAPEDLERVFERFYRTDRARSRSGGAMGTGLGLTIARQIVERHGGRVWLESEGGQGTTAIVRLPREASDAAH